jgi:hypothetical protein
VKFPLNKQKCPVKSALVQPILSSLREIHATVILIDLIPISKKTDRISVTKTTRLKLRQTVAVYHENQTHELWGHVAVREVGGACNYHCPFEELINVRLEVKCVFQLCLNFTHFYAIRSLTSPHMSSVPNRNCMRVQVFTAVNSLLESDGM